MLSGRLIDFTGFFKAAYSDANEHSCSCRTRWTSGSKNSGINVCFASVCLGPPDLQPATRSEGFPAWEPTESFLLSELSQGLGYSITHPPRFPHYSFCLSQCTYSGSSKIQIKKSKAGHSQSLLAPFRHESLLWPRPLK